MRHGAWGILVGAWLAVACGNDHASRCAMRRCEEPAPANPSAPGSRPGPTEPREEPPPAPRPDTPGPLSTDPCVTCATNGACAPEGIGRCASAQTQGNGLPAWSRVFPGLPVHELAVQRPDDTAVLLSGTTLVAVKPGGQVLWEKQHASLRRLWALTASPVTGELYVQSTHSPMCDGLDTCALGASRYRIQANGDCPTWLGTASNGCSTTTRGLDAGGRELTLTTCAPGSNAVLDVGVSRSEPAWSLSLASETGAERLPFLLMESTFDARGNVLVAGAALRRFELQGRMLGHEGYSTPLLLAFDPRGTLLWAEDQSPREGFFSHVAADACGRVRAVLRTLDLPPWIPGRPGTGIGLAWHLVSLAPDGEPQWSRRLPDFDAPPRLAVSADGRAAVAGPVDWGFGGQLVTLYEADGGFRGWNRVTRAMPSASLELSGLDFQDGSPVLAGKLRGDMDVGSGTVRGPDTPGAWDGLMLAIPW